MKWARCLIMLVALGAPSAWCVQPGEMLSDPALEARARTLSRELRCMVCQNQSIDDSDAPLARDLRIIVRERLQAGDSDTQVIEFLTSRYGEFVLLRPSLSWRTSLLWFAPLILLIAGAGWLVLAARRKRTAAIDSTPLSSDDERRIQEIIHR